MLRYGGMNQKEILKTYAFYYDDYLPSKCNNAMVMTLVVL